MTITGTTGPQSCTFCGIVRGSVAAQKIYETDEFLAFFPLSPATKGHTLVIPKSHIRDFTSASPKVFGALTSTAVRLSAILCDTFSPSGMNLITSAGQSASQSVMHLHVHLVPRWDGDEMGEIWPAKQPTRPEELAQWAKSFQAHAGIK
ncbi:HIT family protein [Streptomyces formicae]|uniref:HIT family protein n=1 Tax=Streptomyces formicae TaxID=1616117 RepID=UPI000BF4DDF1|nr:HIT family protein [Streptomyces formicae]